MGSGELTHATGWAFGDFADTPYTYVVCTYGVRGRDVLLEVCTMVCAAIRLFGMTTGTFLSPLYDVLCTAASRGATLPRIPSVEVTSGVEDIRR